MLKTTFIAAGALLALSVPVLADDWTAVKLRGGVFTYVGDHWVQVLRGDVVPDGQVIRTEDGRVQFVRGQELVELGPDTQIQISDQGTGKPFTTVKQWYGKVAIEAEVENVQHFAVRTPDLAAVVKGTKFIVSSQDGESSVDVTRGHVAVHDARRDLSVTVSAGQSVTTGNGQVMQVAGSGELPKVINGRGKPVDLDQFAGKPGKPGHAPKAADVADTSTIGGGSSDASDPVVDDDPIVVADPPADDPHPSSRGKGPDAGESVPPPLLGASGQDPAPVDDDGDGDDDGGHHHHHWHWWYDNDD